MTIIGMLRYLNFYVNLIPRMKRLKTNLSMPINLLPRKSAYFNVKSRRFSYIAKSDVIF